MYRTESRYVPLANYLNDLVVLGVKDVVGLITISSPTSQDERSSVWVLEEALFVYVIQPNPPKRIDCFEVGRPHTLKQQRIWAFDAYWCVATLRLTPGPPSSFKVHSSFLPYEMKLLFGVDWHQMGSKRSSGILTTPPVHNSWRTEIAMAFESVPPRVSREFAAVASIPNI